MISGDLARAGIVLQVPGIAGTIATAAVVTQDGTKRVAIRKPGAVKCKASIRLVLIANTIGAQTQNRKLNRRAKCLDWELEILLPLVEKFAMVERDFVVAVGTTENLQSSVNRRSFFFNYHRGFDRGRGVGAGANLAENIFLAKAELINQIFKATTFLGPKDGFLVGGKLSGEHVEPVVWVTIVGALIESRMRGGEVKGKRMRLEPNN